MTESLSRPVPVVEAVSAAYWSGAREHRLVLTRCPRCRVFVHPPQPVCPRCAGAGRIEELVGEQVSGRGRVYTFSVMRGGGVPGFEPPFAVAVVELAEQDGLLTVGNVLDCPPEELTVGMPVTVAFEEIAEGVVLPQWRREDPR